MATNTNADQKQVVDPTNFNAWRKTVNPNADDYTFQGNEKDKPVIDWANKNGYDNSKNYSTQAPMLRQAQQPQAQQPQAPSYNYGLADQAENEYLQRNKQDDTYLSRFSSIYPAPKEYTSQQEETQRNAASVAESLKSLAEIYGQAKGAHLQARAPEKSDKAEQLIRYNRNKHDEDLRAYQRAYIAAAGQDSEYLQQLRAKALGYGQNIAKNDYLSQKAAYDRAMKENDIEKANTLKKEMQKSSQAFTASQNQKKINAAAENKRNSSSSINIQDNTGLTYDIPYRDWNVKAQDVYEKMKANGLPKLMTTKKDPSDIAGMRVIDVEDKNPNNIRAYVERNLHNTKAMTPDMWNEVSSLSTKTPYPASAQKSKGLNSIPKEAPKGIGNPR